MIPINLRELADRLGGTLMLPAGSVPPDVLGFATDSREVRDGYLFIAIRGAQVDGHAFAEDARQAGAAAVLVERGVSGPHILVANVVSAFARMARSFREEFEGPVIAVTGSAGKSSTKEFVAAALASLGPVLKTAGNRNTEYTAPLMWAEGNGSVAVVEMGMRGPGQIAHLASFTLPTIAVITNIGVAHLSELGSREAIARAKGELLEALPADGVAILWAEDDYLDKLTNIFENRKWKIENSSGSSRRLLTFGFSESADARIVDYEVKSWSVARIRIAYKDSVYTTFIGVIGEHFALNAVAAFLAAVAAGAEPEAAAHGMAHAELPPMRMAAKTVGETTYLLDMYNASPPAMIGALATIADVRSRFPNFAGSPFVAVLGEMRELGEFAEEGHRLVGAALPPNHVDEVILLAANPGSPTSNIECLRKAAVGAGMPASNIRIASSHDEVKAFLSNLTGPLVVLVKGSRAVELERALPDGVL